MIAELAANGNVITSEDKKIYFRCKNKYFYFPLKTSTRRKVTVAKREKEFFQRKTIRFLFQNIIAVERIVGKPYEERGEEKMERTFVIFCLEMKEKDGRKEEKMS